MQVVVRDGLQALFRTPSRADVERWCHVVAGGQVANRCLGQRRPQRSHHEQHRTQTADLHSTRRTTLGGLSSLIMASIPSSQ